MPITWSNQTRRLGDLIPWQRNPRQMRAANVTRLQESHGEFGQVDVIAIGPANQLYNGHQRLRAWGAEYGPDLMVDVRVASRELTEQEREKLTVYLHQGATGEWDFDALANDFDLGDLLDWGFTPFDLGLGVERNDTAPADGDDQDAAPAFSRSDVPDAIFASDNEWEVPLLDIRKQAQFVDAPIVRWGTGSRAYRHNGGTCMFYTDDYRFTALWTDPSPVVNAQFVNVVEPNFSIYRNMPRCGALWQVFRKRWLARYWQDMGMRLFVDLNVPPWAQEFNFLGVPQGWRAYMTRGATDLPDETVTEYEIARTHAGTDDLLFVVYGGGKQIKALCQARGWVWVPEVTDTRKGRYTNGQA